MCRECTERGKVAAQDSLKRQAQAGLRLEQGKDGTVRVKNWQTGDPFWWRASGCYGDKENKENQA